jgi:hypothetical protein
MELKVLRRLLQKIYLITNCLRFWQVLIFTKLENAGTTAELLRDRLCHKVLTYIEFRAVSDVFKNIDLLPPSPPSECVLPTEIDTLE